jgi:hypothetical protein
MFVLRSLVLSCSITFCFFQLEDEEDDSDEDSDEDEDSDDGEGGCSSGCCLAQACLEEDQRLRDVEQDEETLDADSVDNGNTDRVNNIIVEREDTGAATDEVKHISNRDDGAAAERVESITGGVEDTAERGGITADKCDNTSGVVGRDITEGQSSTGAAYVDVRKQNISCNSVVEPNASAEASNSTGVTTPADIVIDQRSDQSSDTNVREEKMSADKEDRA